MIKRSSLKEDSYSNNYSTIGKDKISWTFSKANRFPCRVIRESPTILELPSTLSRRATSFGLGKRWKPKNPKGKDSQSPDKYNLRTCFELEKRGAFFTVDIRSSSRKKDSLPGPGSYEIGSTLSKGSPKFSFRKKLISKRFSETPSPGNYNPRYNLIETYKFTTFGISSRDNNSRSGTPGPGSYDIPSFFKKK